MNEVFSPLSDPQIRIEYVAEAHLNPVWRIQVLSDFFWRLYYNDAPGAGVFIRGEKYELQPHSIYLLPPHCNLQTWCDGDPLQLYIHFEIANILGNEQFPCIPVPLDESIRMLIAALKTALGAEPDGYRARLLSLSLAALAVSMLPPESLTLFHADARIRKACDHIRKNIAREVNLEKLSMLSGMSLNSFLRCFRENTGTTPYQYLLHLRYARAAQMLEGSILPIDEICELVGVHDRFHFSRTFKQINGVPPAEYRKQYLAGHRS